MHNRLGWLTLVTVNLLFLGVLSFYQTSAAAPAPSGAPPFANSLEQRMEIAGQLKELNAQLKELNALLRSGNLKVIVREIEKH